MFNVTNEIKNNITKFRFPFIPEAEANTANINDTGQDNEYSPMTMNPYWPRISRLIFVVFFSIFGSIMNGFFVSSFCVNNSIRKLGNLFLACAGIADMLITAAVMPVVAVVLLSGEWETLYVCKFLQFMTQTATYAFSLNFAFVGAENYFRVCCNSNQYQCFSVFIKFIAALIFLLSALTAAAGAFMDMDYDYCTREQLGDYHFKLITSILFTILPCFLVYGFLIASAIVIRKKNRGEVRYRRTRIYGREMSLLRTNLIAYTLYILAWLPYFIIVNRFPTTKDSNYYNTAWTGVLRSVAFGFMYGTIDRNFRHTFSHLFDYCCCKSTLSHPFAGRHRHRPHTYGPAMAEVRVHIMHQAFHHHAPQRGTPAIRETQAL